MNNNNPNNSMTNNPNANDNLFVIAPLVFKPEAPCSFTHLLFLFCY